MEQTWEEEKNKCSMKVNDKDSKSNSFSKERLFSKNDSNSIDNLSGERSAELTPYVNESRKINGVVSDAC